MEQSQNTSVLKAIRTGSSMRPLDLGWLKLQDHFIATVGPFSGTGTPLGKLLVLADAEIAPHSSFPMHPHADMEILTWVVKGRLHHKDNKGTDQFVESLGLQLMSARSGIMHAEGNSDSQPVRLLQIWIQPKSQLRGNAVVAKTELSGAGFKLLAGTAEAPLIVNQDVQLFAAKLSQEKLDFIIPNGRSAYAVSIGELLWDGKAVPDGAGIELQSGPLKVEGEGQAIVLIQE